jgi:hypothetical protein
VRPRAGALERDTLYNIVDTFADARGPVTDSPHPSA